jgi:hypothetical protein
MNPGTTLIDAVGAWAKNMYPTPTAVQYGNNRGGSMGRTGPVRPSLGAMASSLPAHDRRGESSLTLASTQRSLNPRFVEWLMGLPDRWTDCKPVDSAACRSWLRSHSQRLRQILESR